MPADAGTAWRHGLRLGLHCSYCCAGLTAILLVIGVRDLRAMAVVTAAPTLERLAPVSLSHFFDPYFGNAVAIHLEHGKAAPVVLYGLALLGNVAEFH